MKNRFIIALLLVLSGLFLAGCQNDRMETPESADAGVEGQDIIPGIVRVKFKSDADVQALENSLAKTAAPLTRTGITSMDALSGKYQIKSIKRLFRYSPKFEDLHRKHGLHLWYELELDTTINTRSVAVAYDELAEVACAYPVRRIVSCDNGITIPVDAVPQAFDAATRAALPFNDKLLGKQWHYDRGELMTPLEEANIGLFPAWEVCAGSPNVIVAIIDGGIDYTHEDLGANMWINEAERSGTAGKDDDGNNYVDDVYGYNFASQTGTIQPQSHGTHVAGTVGAVNNNGLGVCGVAGGSGKGDGVRLMSCQIFGDKEDSKGQPEAMVYAADMGAVISQNSWGYTSPGYTEPAMEEAINYFIQEAGNPAKHPNSPMRGGLVVFAAGNDGAVAKTYYPAAYEQCVAVTATDYRNERASLTQTDHYNGTYYANVAPWVDLSAPGGMNDPGTYGVLSTIPGGYGYKSGTSMACPHVSGVAALVVSKMGGPGFTCEKLKEILYSSVLDLSEYETKYARYMGGGLIRADLALASAMPSGVVSDLKVVEATSNNCKLGWTVAGNPPVSYRVYYSTSALTAGNYASAKSVELTLNGQAEGAKCELAVGGLEQKMYYFAVVALDKAGKAGELSNQVSAWMMAPNEGKAYPTAVKDYTTLTLGTAFSGTVDVTVYNAGGSRALELEFRDQRTFRVNLSGLMAGIYTLKVKSAGAETTMKVVKM